MRNPALKTLYVYNGIFVFAGSLLGPLYAVYVGLIDSAIMAVSISWAVFLLATLGFTTLVSRFGDRVEQKEYMLLVGFAIRAIAWFLYMFVASIPHLIFLQIFLGLGEAFGTPAFQAIFAEHLDDGRHIKEYADWRMVSLAATGVSTVIGGIIVSTVGFLWVFALMSALATIAFFGVWTKPRELL